MCRISPWIGRPDTRQQHIFLNNFTISCHDGYTQSAPDMLQLTCVWPLSRRQHLVPHRDTISGQPHAHTQPILRVCDTTTISHVEIHTPWTWQERIHFLTVTTNRAHVGYTFSVCKTLFPCALRCLDRRIHSYLYTEHYHTTTSSCFDCFWESQNDANVLILTKLLQPFVGLKMLQLHCDQSSRLSQPHL